MLKESAISTCRELKVGLILLIGTLGSVFAQSYKTAYDADEALLEKLQEVRLTNWVGFQLDLMKTRYSDRTNDIQYIDAAFAKTSKLRVTKLEKIGASSTRFGEAQFQVGMNKATAKEKIPYLKRAYDKLKTNNDKAELNKKVFRYLLSYLVEAKQIKQAVKLLKESGNDDKRYLEYQSARLQLMMADKELESTGKLTGPTKTMVATVIKMLTKGELFWQSDMMAMLGYTELAHAYVLLSKPHDAVKALSGSFSQIIGFDKMFKGDDRIHSPKIPAMYYLARAYVLHYKLVKAGGKRPKSIKVGNEIIRKPSKAQCINYYLIKAFNINESDLQTKDYRKSSLSKNALRDNEDVRKYMQANGIKPPKEKPDNARILAEEKAYDFYRAARALQQEGDELAKAKKEKEAAEKHLAAVAKFKEAIPQFEIAARDKRGLYKGEASRDALFYLSASYCHLKDFRKAKEYAFKCVQYFKEDPRAWDAIYNVGIKAKKAAYELRDTKQVESAVLRKLASAMYMKIAKENKAYPKIAGVLWQGAIDKWGEAKQYTDKKIALSKQIAALVKANAAASDIKAKKKELNDIVEKIKEAYMEAIPFFQILIDNYANSEYGSKAIYRIGWIYYINEEKLKAVDYFLKYCKREPTITADYLDAKYVSADILFRDGQMDRAEELFKDVIAQSAKDKIDTSNASIKKRVTKSRIGAQALLPWISDRKGEELLDTSEAMVDQNEELTSLIGLYAAASMKNKEEKKPVVKLQLPTPPPLAKNAPKAFTAGKIPENYAFKAFLERLPITVDLIATLPADITITFKDNLLWVTKGLDTIGCVGGKGFDVTVTGKRVNWKSKDVACYRDGKLVCIYLPETFQSRVANEGEAPATIELPPSTEDIPAQQLDIRLQFLQKQASANRVRFEKVRQDGLSLQQKGLAGMIEFLKTNAKNKTFGPTILLRMATIYVSLEDWAKAADTLTRLQTKFPKSSAADKAPIYFYRVIMNAIKKEDDKLKKQELLVKANTQATKIIQTIKDQSKGNINMLAFRLFDPDGKGGEINQNPDLAFAAVEELLRRGETEKHPDHQRFKRIREKGLLYKAKILSSKGVYADAVIQIDKLLTEKPNSAYFFKAMTLKAQILAKMKKYLDAKKTIMKVVTKASAIRNNFKVEYWIGVLESGRIYAAIDDKASQKTAKNPLEQCIEGINFDEKDLQFIREGAFFELFRVYKKLGDNQKAIKLKNEYFRMYPNGAYHAAFSTVK